MKRMAVNQDSLLRVARKANELFVIPGGIDRLLEPMSVSDGTRAPLFEVVAAFCTNIRSVVSTAGIPYTFALEASHRRRHQLLECAAELEATLDGTRAGQGVAGVAELARRDAQERMRDVSASEDGRAALNHEACCLLLDVSKVAELHEAAGQLVLQAAVLTWGAFEVLSRDIFKEHLNRTPSAYAQLVADTDVRKRFELGKIPIERVADFGFDLSAKLGEFLADQNDLTDLGTIKATMLALFPANERLRTALAQRDLWTLFQRRHLIVHRRGIVDRRYLEATGDPLEIRARLAINPQELTRYLGVVVEAAGALVSAAG